MIVGWELIDKVFLADANGGIHLANREEPLFSSKSNVTTIYRENPYDISPQDAVLQRLGQFRLRKAAPETRMFLEFA